MRYYLETFRDKDGRIGLRYDLTEMTQEAGDELVKRLTKCLNKDTHAWRLRKEPIQLNVGVLDEDEYIDEPPREYAPSGADHEDV